jgi:hypothetical protein
MKFRQRFNVARQIAEEQIKAGDYRWTPKTTAGWIIRIACTDVGQGAWELAKGDQKRTGDQDVVSEGVRCSGASD